jgi:hypothetical protein
MSDGEYERAIELFEESLAIGEARGDLDRRARELSNLGRVMRALGEGVRAHELFRSGLAAAEEIVLVPIELLAMWGIAAYEGEGGDAVAAARLLGCINEERTRLGTDGDADHIMLEERLRDSLGTERLASELAVGAALALGEAIDLALGRSDSTKLG